jgi:hypothetical protein
MQALENVKNPLGVLGLKANALIPHGKPPVSPFLDRSDLNPGRLLPAKLQRIPDQVLPYLS